MIKGLHAAASEEAKTHYCSSSCSYPAAAAADVQLLFREIKGGKELKSSISRTKKTRHVQALSTIKNSTLFLLLSLLLLLLAYFHLRSLTRFRTRSIRP